MTGFWGAESEAVRQQAAAGTAAAGRLESLLADCSALVTGVEWTGADAETFRERWGREVRARLEHVLDELRRRGAELDRHAEEQDRTSADDGGGLGIGMPGIPRLPSLPLPTLPGVPTIPTLPAPPGTPHVLTPFPSPPRATFRLSDCDLPWIDEDIAILGTRPVPEVIRCFPPFRTLPEIFPPSGSEAWPLPVPDVMPLPGFETLPAPVPTPDVMPLPGFETLPAPAPAPWPAPEDWPLPQPLPAPLPLPELWPMPQPLPRPGYIAL